MEKTIKIPEGYEARIDGNKVIIEPKESEDEKIRKALIRGIESVCKEEEVFTGGFTRKQIVSWLEKQGEQNLANSAKTCKNEHNPAWSKEDERMINKAESWLDTLCDYLKDSSSDCIYEVKSVIDWFKSLKNRLHNHLKNSSGMKETIARQMLESIMYDNDMVNREEPLDESRLQPSQTPFERADKMT